MTFLGVLLLAVASFYIGWNVFQIVRILKAKRVALKDKSKKEEQKNDGDSD